MKLVFEIESESSSEIPPVKQVGIRILWSESLKMLEQLFVLFWNGIVARRVQISSVRSGFCLVFRVRIGFAH